MPGAAHNCLNSIHMVAGCDAHKTIPPPVPVPPFAPHVVVYCLGFILNPGTSMKSTTVQCGWGYALGRQHDIGPGPYHFWANVLLPLIWLGAGNKAEFGASTVKVSTIQGPKNMAVAVIPFVGLNMQLDCQDFPIPPLPTSIAVASFNTVRAGFTWADFAGGIASMVFDSVVTWAVNGVISFATGALGNALTKGLGGAFSGVLGNIFKVSVQAAPTLEGAALSAGAKYFWGAAANSATSAAGLALGWFGIGTPLGYSYSGSPVGGPSGDINDKLNSATHDFFDPPSPAPKADGPVPTPAPAPAPSTPPDGGAPTSPPAPTPASDAGTGTPP